MSTHGDSADATYSKQREINEAWQQLQARANARKEKLLDSYDLQRYVACDVQALRPLPWYKQQAAGDQQSVAAALLPRIAIGM